MSTLIVSLEDIIASAKMVVNTARYVADRESLRAACVDDLSNIVESELYQDLDELNLDDYLPDEEVEEFYGEASDAAEREAWMVLGAYE